MEQKNILIGAGVIIVLGIVVWALMGWLAPKSSDKSIPDITLDQSISDGAVTLEYPSADFGLATKKDQILVNSYIPPCDEAFNYCFYYNGKQYEGTNFESAGLRWQKRDDLKTQDTCINTPPKGFEAEGGLKPDARAVENTYVMGKFSNVSQGAAGHFAVGSMYRLFVKGSSSCYEFEMRVGQTQFANYPAGTKKEFTSQDLAVVASKVLRILYSAKLSTGETNLFSAIEAQ